MHLSRRDVDVVVIAALAQRRAQRDCVGGEVERDLRGLAEHRVDSCREMTAVLRIGANPLM